MWKDIFKWGSESKHDSSTQGNQHHSKISSRSLRLSAVLPSLPIEIYVFYIFPHLPAWTLLDCCLVSKEWNAFLSEEDTWKMVCSQWTIIYFVFIFQLFLLFLLFPYFYVFVFKQLVTRSNVNVEAMPNPPTAIKDWKKLCFDLQCKIYPLCDTFVWGESPANLSQPAYSKEQIKAYQTHNRTILIKFDLHDFDGMFPFVALRCVALCLCVALCRVALLCCIVLCCCVAVLHCVELRCAQWCCVVQCGVV